MDDDAYAKGMAMRRAVLGENFVTAAEAAASEFTRPFLDFVTRYAWGTVWARPGLPRETRSMLNLAMLTALNRPQELAIHIRAGLRNGLTREEIIEVLWQTSIHAGVPAAMAAFRIADAILREPPIGS